MHDLADGGSSLCGWQTCVALAGRLRTVFMAFTMLLLPCCAPRCAAHMEVSYMHSIDKEAPSYCYVPELLVCDARHDSRLQSF